MTLRTAYGPDTDTDGKRTHVNLCAVEFFVFNFGKFQF